MFATMGFLMMGCDNGNNGGPQIIRHEGVAPDGTIFVLIITDGTNFELRVGTGANEAISTGTATLTGGVWSLTPVVNGTPAETFTITAGSDGITNIEGTITFENAPPQQAPPSINPVPPTPPGGGGNNNQPTPGTPISITITGIPAEHNGQYASVFFRISEDEYVVASCPGYGTIITNGSISVPMYIWFSSPPFLLIRQGITLSFWIFGWVVATPPIQGSSTMAQTPYLLPITSNPFLLLNHQDRHLLLEHP